MNVMRGLFQEEWGIFRGANVEDKTVLHNVAFKKGLVTNGPKKNPAGGFYSSRRVHSPT